MLVSCSHVRTKHSQLVPAKVSYEAFWMRYFYRMHRLEKVRGSYIHLTGSPIESHVYIQEEKRRAELMARASNRSQEQLQWDEETEEGMA